MTARAGLSRRWRPRSGLFSGGVAVSLLLAAPPALATGPLGADGDPIRTSNYAVDLTQTPVVAGGRVTGLAGAYVALGEGVDGNVQTPAAPAIRVPYSVDHFDYDLGFSVTLPTALASSDFFNSGHERTQLTDAKQEGFVFVTPALNVMWGRFGLGGTVELQNYSMRRSDADPTTRTDRVEALFAVAHLQAANLFLDGQLSVGLGLRLVNLDVNNPNAPSAERSLFNTLGTGAEVGAVWMPHDAPYRLGAALRSAVTSEPNPESQVQPNAGGDRIVGDPLDPNNAFWLPDRIRVPWDLNVGAAVQLGARPLNPPWIDPADRDRRVRREIRDLARARMARAEESRKRRAQDGALSREAEQAFAAEADAEAAADELSVEAGEAETRALLRRRERDLPRRYVLITGSLLVLGKVQDSVGVESFLQHIVARSGEKVGLSPRLGVETEAIPRWLKIRGGTYLEPTRFASSEPRLHGTVGLDAKVLPWTVFGLFDEGTEWRLSASLDGAARYLSWGVGLGVWH